MRENKNENNSRNCLFRNLFNSKINIIIQSTQRNTYYVHLVHLFSQEK